MRAVPRAALFDMDRTLVRVDTATLYVRYQRDIGEAGIRDVARVAWWMLQYSLGVIDAERIAEQVLRSYAGKEEAWLEERCRTWFREYVLAHVADQARETVERHRRAGDLLAIVTGATPYAAAPLAQELGIPHVIATSLEVEAGRFTGSLRRPMSYGAGKVTLSQGLAAREGFTLDDATFYSDSITDLPLLERVGTPVAVNPDARLKRLAGKRRWRIERW